MGEVARGNRWQSVIPRADLIILRLAGFIIPLSGGEDGDLRHWWELNALDYHGVLGNRHEHTLTIES
jgi:hypothetical protein